MIRLFVALNIPEEIIDEIFKHCFSVVDNANDYRWEARDKIHLTLKFIGDIKEDLLTSIIEDLEFVKNYSTFHCTISKFGFFFRDNQAKILWCNVETDDTIISLTEELNRSLEKFNIEIEKRKFKGHLTLMRIKKPVSEKFIRSFKEYTFDPIQFNSNEIELIKSELKPTGSEYKVLKIYELK